MEKALVVVAGLLGAGGIAAAAASAHSGDQRLMGAVALVAVGNAPVLLFLSATARENAFRAIAGLLIASGAILFCGDLGMRAANGSGLFPMAAPGGGFAMIGGWLAVAASAFTGKARQG